MSLSVSYVKSKVLKFCKLLIFKDKVNLPSKWAISEKAYKSRTLVDFGNLVHKVIHRNCGIDRISFGQ
jgi:hypothetical protein